MIEIFIAKVVSSQELARLEHWRSKSYAQHTALGEFYGDIASQLDKIVECYQGAFGIINIPELPAIIYKKDIIKALESDVKWITDNQKAICNGLSTISNMIDSTVEIYFTTLYKLKNLS